MKNLFYFLLIGGLIVFGACGDEETPEPPNYLVEITSPNTDNKRVGDVITLNVTVNEENGGTVHHFNVKVYERDDATKVIFDGPSEAHVHEEDGSFTFTEDLTLDVDPHSNWIVEVKVWGHEAGVAEKIETIEFHVHPNTPNYVIDIQSPNADDKKVGDMVELKVNVTDMHGGTVHHFKLKVYNKADNSDVIYDGPSEAHVHEEDGDYTFTDNLDLSNVAPDTDWVLEAKVWGHEAGAAEKMETMEFHVNPQ